MKLLLMADSAVGSKIYDFLASNFQEDLTVIGVMREDAPLAGTAKAAGFPVIVYQSSKQFSHDLLSGGFADKLSLGVLAWWPKIIRPQAFQIPFLNFHPSLLPHNRGKNPNFWALVEQVPFGVTLHLIDEGVDTGPIVAQRKIDYDWTDTGESLYRRAIVEIVELFQQTYPHIRRQYTQSRMITAIAQPEGGSFHRAAELEPASTIDLDATYTARDLLNRLRGRTFPGYPGCSFVENGRRYEVRIEITTTPADDAGD
ncbi:MAG TPA: formyltransferase family protein [Microvirga sp.]|nr:formyltransferase family protein [Microvirga sp.]